MAKKDKDEKASVEDKFISVLKKNRIKFQSKLFNLGDKLYLPNFVFGRLVVEVEEDVSANRLEVINKFKKSFAGYRVVLLAGDQAHYIAAAKEFDEVFNFDSVNLLLAEIKENLRKGTN
jgi:hypothetical protein